MHELQYSPIRQVSQAVPRRKSVLLVAHFAYPEDAGLRPKKGCVPKIDLKFRAPLINFLFLSEKIFQRNPMRQRRAVQQYNTGSAGA